MAAGPHTARPWDANIRTDENFVVNRWDAGAQRLFGLTAQEAIGRPTYELFAPVDPAERVDRIRRLREHGEIHTASVWTRQDGSALAAEGHAQAIRRKDTVIGYQIGLRELPRLHQPPPPENDLAANSGRTACQRGERLPAGQSTRDARDATVAPMAVIDSQLGPPPRRTTLEDMRRTLAEVDTDLDELPPERLREIQANLEEAFKRDRTEWIRRAFAVRLRVARGDAELSQADLSKAVDVKPYEIARWENATKSYARLATIENRIRLADALRVPRSHFLPELEIEG